MKKSTIVIEVLIMALLGAGFAVCGNFTKESGIVPENKDTVAVVQQPKEEVIIDCNYTFDEALDGCNAPQELKDQLSLFNVKYISTDGKLHQGQILSNKEIEQDIKDMFELMLKEGFVVEKAIPVVKYNWDDSESMKDNNSYCFCYRDMSYSFHANGMAIDINPFFNPQRWKGEWRNSRRDKPEGAVYDTTRNGTFVEGSVIVNAWKSKGFNWGHYMTRKSDDHHFQKAAFNAKPSFPWRTSVANDAVIDEHDVDAADIKPSKSSSKSSSTKSAAESKPRYNKYQGLSEEEIAEKERLSENWEKIKDRTRRHRSSADSITGQAWKRN